MPYTRLAAAAALAVTCGITAAGEIEQAEANRKKPLQRCDQLAAKAQIECLQKARERIVEARRKREASGKDAKPSAVKPEQNEPAPRK